MSCTVDRIENGIAVCIGENEEELNIPLRSIAGSPAEGDVIVQKGSGWVISPERTQERRRSIIELQNSLWNDRS